MNKSQQKGFTLIELVVVIVILGILAATALPRFIDMRADAANAGVAGVAGGLASASAINYAGTLTTPPKTVTPTTFNGNSSTICAAGTGGTLLQSGLPSGYSLTALSAGQTCAAGGTNSCVVSYVSGGTTYSTAATVTCY